MTYTRLNERQKRTALAAFGALLELPYDKLNTMVGSETIKEINELYYKLRYEDYCKRHGIKNWKKMDEADYENWYHETYCTYESEE